MRDTNQPTTQNRTVSISRLDGIVGSGREEQRFITNVLKTHFSLLLLYSVLVCTGFYLVSALQLLAIYF